MIWTNHFAICTCLLVSLFNVNWYPSHALPEFLCSLARTGDGSLDSHLLSIPQFDLVTFWYRSFADVRTYQFNFLCNIIILWIPACVWFYFSKWQECRTLEVCCWCRWMKRMLSGVLFHSWRDKNICEDTTQTAWSGSLTDTLSNTFSSV